ncbi:archaeal proteasome endopeptidase complex subunit alpha [Natrialba asiatica]|uniref:Proteasome subunit alpha n=1 Tax=Natrialba asiatica (strain ATCC 700177 / DSM 12278 / JCM 9576 / FERM P-10747 / NBRC 102637 / 172P1) TaxID=29540 RepID=M0AYS8_NATA1|nr:archaeal proteasome endopeptidase complex subunit alpha [Natrialba asiatica]ELZ02559.1 proteasome subunit alpha [Natrialba asiatica DSM 12278]
MNTSSRQRAYDRGHTIFSPDGRLYQVEYAREAVERGSPSVGVVTSEGVVLAARKRVRSPLLEPDSVEKIHRVDDHLAVATAGHAADARQLVEAARKRCQQHRLQYGEPIGVSVLASDLADHIQEQTQSGGTRPYGAAVLVGGVDPGPGPNSSPTPDDRSADETERERESATERTVQPALYEVDPGGTFYGWRGTAIGDGTAEIRSFLETELDGGDSTAATPDLTRDRGLSIALDALATTAADDRPISASTVTARVLGPESDSGQSTPVGDDELERVLAALESD